MRRPGCYAALIVLTVLRCSWGLEPEPPAPIPVGLLHSLTGSMAISERSLVDAMLMAIEEINEQGGVLGRPLKPILEDGKSDWPTFARKAEKLIVEDKVASVFGCWTSASRKEVLPIVEQHNHLLWYPVQYEGRESSPNIIYTGAAPNQQITPAVEWCRREFGSRMFLVGSNYIFPQTANKLIKMRLAEYGAKPVGEEYAELEGASFDAIAAKIRQTNPDVVLNTLNGASNREFFQALRAAGVEGREIPVMSFSIAEDELRYIGVDLTQGHYCSWNYFQSIDTPANRRFVREFRRRYGEDRVTDDPIESAYFQMHLFAKAVGLAGSTEVAAIREAARGLIFAAPGGLVRIDPTNQHTWKVSRIGRIQSDGQFKIVFSSDDPLPPRPYLPEPFLFECRRQGTLMFKSISEMIELEADEASDSERKKLLGAMADVRGFLGDARAKFQSAALLIQPSSRQEFEEAWSVFERKWSDLSGMAGQLTLMQRASFEQFDAARSAYREIAADMFDALYPDPPAPREVTR